MIIASPFHSPALYTRNMSSGLKIMSSCSVFISDNLRILYGISNKNVSPRGRSFRQISNSRTYIGVEYSHEWRKRPSEILLRSVFNWRMHLASLYFNRFCIRFRLAEIDGDTNLLYSTESIMLPADKNLIPEM
jgi:hypothetical protein